MNEREERDALQAYAVAAGEFEAAKERVTCAGEVLAAAEGRACANAADGRALVRLPVVATLEDGRTVTISRVPYEDHVRPGLSYEIARPL